MKKNIFYLMLVSLTLFSLMSVMKVNAQITIGKDTISHPGAALELRADKGLLLPRVNLVKTDGFQLSDKASEASAIGMIVYNTNRNIEGGKGEGVYAWNGNAWTQMIITGKDIPVAKITITADTTTISANGMLQFKAKVEPEDASNKDIAWSVVSGLGWISNTGLFTAGSDKGEVIIKAEAVDGSNRSDEKTITVVPVGLHKENGYDVYTFASNTGLGTWMVENSKEQKAGETVLQNNGIYYYTHKQATKFACPAGYRLPTGAEWMNLGNYINDPATPQREKDYWINSTSLAGHHLASSSLTQFAQFGEYGYWWTAANEESFYVLPDQMGVLLSLGAFVGNTFSMTVRCIKE